MSAQDNLSGAQFMSARHILNNYNLMDSTDLSSQYDEAKKNGLAKDILKNGVKTPIEIHEGMGSVMNGHHRLAVMSKHKPDTPLPVIVHNEEDHLYP